MFLNAQTIKRHSILVLIGFFAISIAVRLPSLNRPLSKHHEVNAAYVLINAEEWNHRSPAFYHYVPVHSYHIAGDQVTTEVINNGYQVNVSFGSLWYMMPYFFFKVLQVAPSPLALQVFNLLLHFICILLVYYLALALFGQQNNLKPLTAAVLYVFCPAPLWFHGNAYVHEVAVLPFIYGSCLLFVNWLRRPGKNPPILLFLLVAAGIWCDWLMCFVAAAMFLVSGYLYFQRNERRQLYNMLGLGGTVIVAIIAIVIQFSSFMGFDNYVNSLYSRFLWRSIGGSVQAAGIAANAGLGSFYLAGYGLMLPVVVVIFMLLRKLKIEKDCRLLYNFLFIAGAVCMLHHLVFWGFSNIHDYAVIKSGFIVSTLTTLALYKMKAGSRKIAVVVLLVTNVAVYYFVNRPGKYAANGQPYTYFKTLGETIKKIAKPGDYIFVDTPEMSLLLTYYSKRYYETVTDLHEAKSLFGALPGTNAVFVHTNNFKFVRATRMIKEVGTIK